MKHRKFKGVIEDRRSARKVSFVARLYIDRKTSRSIYGLETAEAAAVAYDDMAREFYGAAAGLNFPREGEKSTWTMACVQCGSFFEVAGVIMRRDKSVCSETCRVAHKRDWQRSYRVNSPEKIRKFNDARNEKHRSNPEPRRAQRRAWRESKIINDPSYREKQRVYNQEWRIRNIDHVRSYNRKKVIAENAVINALKDLGLLSGGI